MKIQHLIFISQLNESSRCGIHNSLLKYRPDLKDEMDSIEGLDVQSSTDFLKGNGLWDEHAEALLDNFKRWGYEFRQGPDEEAKKMMFDHMNKLMCYVAKLIRQSRPPQN